MAAVATLEDYGSDVPEVDSNPLGVYYVAILYPIKAYSTKRCAIDIIKFCGFSFTPTRTGTLPHIPRYITACHTFHMLMQNTTVVIYAFIHDHCHVDL